MSPFGYMYFGWDLADRVQKERAEFRRNNPRHRQPSGKDRSKVKRARKQKHRRGK